MGAYTAFGANIIVRKELRPHVAEFLEAASKPPFPRWEWLADRVDQVLPGDPLVDALREFAQVERSSWIAFAKVHHALAYNWDEHNEFDRESGRWIFTCSLKNYEHTIDEFCVLVIPHLAVEVMRMQVEVDPAAYVRTIHNVGVVDGSFTYLSTAGEAKAEDYSPFGFADCDEPNYDTLEPASEFT